MIKIASGPRSIQRRVVISSYRNFDGVGPLDFDNSHGRGAGAFATFANLVFERLAFLQFLERGALDFRVVEEQFAAFTFDESKSTIRHQLLNLTLWHFCPPLKQNLQKNELPCDTLGIGWLALINSREPHKRGGHFLGKKTAPQSAVSWEKRFLSVSTCIYSACCLLCNIQSIGHGPEHAKTGLGAVEWRIYRITA
jgi:hypothetical protein